MLACILGVAVACATGHARAQEVYVGTADQWPDLVAHPGQWQFVRDHADGLYVNFIMMKQQPALRLRQTGKLMRHRNAFLESDLRTPRPGDIASGASPQDDRDAIAGLQSAGFRVAYTSLNYGWDASRAALLGSYGRQRSDIRPDLVQIGPWTLGGDLATDPPGARNAAYRDWIRNADGVSTDGPMGFWLDDRGHMRQASISMVRFAHRNRKRASVMLCPYGAGNSHYGPQQFLAVAQDAVREHEDADAVPDIWSVFEYATAIPAVPEQENGRATSTTTGVAYWLLKHLRDPDHSLSVSVAGGWRHTSRGVRTLDVELANNSRWIDFAPRLMVHAGRGAGLLIRPGADSPTVSGIVFTGTLRLLPGQSRGIRVVMRERARNAWLDLFPAAGGNGTPRRVPLPPG